MPPDFSAIKRRHAGVSLPAFRRTVGDALPKYNTAAGKTACHPQYGIAIPRRSGLSMHVAGWLQTVAAR
jgi:hypothetical protein